MLLRLLPLSWGLTSPDMPHPPQDPVPRDPQFLSRRGVTLPFPPPTPRGEREDLYHVTTPTR